MGRHKAAAPKLRCHLSGQSVVTIAGRDFYLGPHNSPKALARHAVLVADYQRYGLELPEGYSVADMDQRASVIVEPVMPHQPTHQADEPVTIRHVMASYKLHIAKIYAANPIEIERLTRLADEISEQDGNMLASCYGPLALQKQRERWVKSGKARVYCNRLTNALVRIMKYAVSQQMLEASAWHALKAVEPLRIGQTDARETEPVQPANLEHVRATVKHLPPTLRAAIRVQVATGARPSEILRMRSVEIDRTGDEWVYRPKMHKNTKRGKVRAIPIVGDAKEAIIDYMNRDPNAYLFSPAESVAWYKAQKRAARKSKVQPSQRDRSKKNPELQPGEFYDVHAYRRAIHRAAKKAGVPEWNPYQLRHLAATVVRDLLGPEEVQALLGHSNIRMTEHYARKSERKAIEAARHAPTVGGAE